MSLIIETKCLNIRDIMCGGRLLANKFRSKYTNSVSCLIVRVKAFETHALTVLLGNLEMHLRFGR